MRNCIFRTAVAVCIVLTYSCKNTSPNNEIPLQDPIVHGRVGAPEAEEEGYDGAMERAEFEFNQIKDPKLGYVPVERMEKAVAFTEELKARRIRNRMAGALTWVERGPIYDYVGPSGNPRGSGTPFTSGRTRAILIDTLNDPSGNTVLLGGVSGGLWKTSNFLNPSPNWTPIDDRFDNLAISSIAQDPSNPAVMYFATGEATSNADAVYGGGIWKSVNSGASWTKLAGTSGFVKTFKIQCDAAGNIYLANRANPSSLPVSMVSGLYRSTDDGATWINITPSTLTSSNNVCTDLEISSTGRLHASFGYGLSGTSRVQHQYTDDPANATVTTGWNAGTGIRITSTVNANRLELAAAGNTLYAITTNSANNVDSCYKSIDGGVNWTLQNTSPYTAGVSNTQGWYNITLAINPENPNEIIMGGLDAYRSVNSGASLAKITNWVTSDPYVHADHHFMQWWKVGSQSRIVLGCDGGVFLSNNGGVSWQDRNRNLAIKQFYATALHPDAGSNYMLAGAQDNGVHQFTNPGLSWSTEVNGGDGCYVHINQQNPQVQFGSYVRNSYNRSTNGGSNWSGITFSSSNGLFVNPFDYDDGQNIMYASWGVVSSPNNQMMRWTNANTSTTASLVTIPALGRGFNANATAFKVSPHQKDRLFVGSNLGGLVRIDNASTVTSATLAANSTDITGAAFPLANLNCVNTGSSDNVLVAVFSNYGVGHVWYSTDGGTNWTNIDGNLPDMPVRWAVFNPQSDSKLFLATEAGVYYTDAVNGSSTVWTSDPSFPTVKTNMLKVRLSDNTILAATHGRGLFTATIPATPEIRFDAPGITVTEASTGLADCRPYTDYTIKTSIVAPPAGNATVDLSLQGGATAIEGQDYAFTTNGDFNNISHQLSFTTGVTATKTITVRVYNDAVVEPEKSFTLQMAVSGSTNAFVGSYNKFSFSIRDNDFAPQVPATVSVGANNTTVGSIGSAFVSERVRHRTQLLFSASELLSAGFTQGLISGMSLYVVTKNSTKPFKGYTISLANTNTANLNTGFTPDVLTQVFSADYSTVVGENQFNFSTPFYWNGTSNLLMQVCFDNGAGPADALSDVLEGSAAPLGASIRGTTSSDVTQSGGSTGCALPAWYIYTPRVRATFKLGNSISSELNDARSESVGANRAVTFYKGTDILGRLSNASNDLGCVSATVSQAGNTWQPFVSGQRSQKVFTVTPTTNAASTYNISLYFSDAELGALAATPGSLKLAKTTAASPASANASNTVIAATTFAAYGTGYVFSANFSGFSHFFLVNDAVALPVTLLTFQGRLNNNTALLTWSTSTEQNLRHFDVEKSTDGVNFYKIGTVAAAGNSQTKKEYALRDTRLSSENYYRLQMNDNDGRRTQSDVVRLSYNNAVQQVTVLNNPFGASLNLQFARQARKVQLQLLAANGSLVAETVLANPSTRHTWPLPGRVSAGTYILRSVVDGAVFTTKLVKP